MSKKLILRIVLNSVLGVVLVLLWSKFVDLGEIGKTLATVDLKFIALLFVFFILSTFLRSLRLKILLKEYKIPLKDISMLHFLSQFLSFMIPIRAGEIAKSVYLNSQFNLPLGKTVVWIFVDRFQDFWAVLFLISFFLLFVPTALSADLARIIFILLIILTLVALFFIKSQHIAKRFVNFLSQLLIVNNIKRWFLSFSHTIIDGFEVLHRSPGEFLVLILLSIVATISDSFIWFFIFSSLGVDLGLAKTILGNSLSALTFLIPAAPGYVGSAEAAGLAVFSGILGLENNLASAATVIFHIFFIISLPVFGVVSLYFLKFDLRLVWKKIRGK